MLNSLQKEVYPFILSSFAGKKGTVTDQRNLYFVFCSEAIELCLRIYNRYIDLDFTRCMFNSYQKFVDFTSKNLILD